MRTLNYMASPAGFSKARASPLRGLPERPRRHEQHRKGASDERELGFRSRPYREGLADAIYSFYKGGYFKWSPNPGSVQRPTHGRRECRRKQDDDVCFQWSLSVT